MAYGHRIPSEDVDSFDLSDSGRGEGEKSQAS